MKKIILVMITTLILLISFQQVVLADIEEDPYLGYFSSYKQNEEKYNKPYYLWPRVYVGDKAELPNRKELEENEFVVYRCDLGFSFGIGLKNIEEILETNIYEYYFGDLKSKWLYYEANKKRPIVVSDATIGTSEFSRIYREGYYPMGIVDMAVMDDYILKLIFDEDIIKNKVNGEIQIHDRYVFHNYNYIGGHDFWIYYKTNMGDYIYELKHYSGEIYRGERYLYPVEEFIYYQRAVVENLKNKLLGVGVLADGGASTNEYDMSVFNVDSSDFNINAKASDIIDTIENAHNNLYYIFGIVFICGAIGVFSFRKKIHSVFLNKK